MPLTILASVSLLALVVTGRPLLPQDFPQLVQPSGEVQDAVQAIFQSRAGSVNLEVDNENEEERPVEGAVQVRLTSSDSQSTYLSRLASEDVKLIIPLGDNVLAPSNDEKILYNALEGLDDLDGGTRPLEEVLSNYSEDDEDIEKDDQEEYPSTVSPSKRDRSLLVLLMMSAASLVILLWLGAILYAWGFVRREVLSGRLFGCEWWPHIAKDIIPRSNGSGGVGFKEKPLILGVDVTEEFTDEKAEVMWRPTFIENPVENMGSSTGDDEEDVFEDASDHPDPDFLPLPSSTSTPSHSPLRRPLQMREIPSNPPSWSVRAFDSPTSPVTLPPPTNPQPPLAVDHVEPLAPRRAYHDLVPEFDLALILQMRPGFGLGADATWIVRFMVGVFGWFTVLVSGGRREEDGTFLQE